MAKKDTRTILFLLNDTDIILLNVIKNKFKKESGWESVIATSYEQAIKSFEQEKPDAVLTEIIIDDHEGRTGFDFIEEIKNKKHVAVPEVIIFTDLGLEDDKERARKLSVSHYFVKSKITLNELTEEIKGILR